MIFKPRTLTVSSLFLLLLLSFSSGISMAQSQRAKDFAELERVLKIDANFKKDTLALINRLDSVKMLAEGKRSIPLKWAYYMLMADGFSIAFDRVNDRSNHFFEKASELIEPTNEYELKQMGLIRQGYYYYVYRKIREAFPYFLQANDLKEEVNVNRIPRLAYHYGFVANFYSYIGDQKRAAEYLKLALPHTEPLSRNRIDMVNAIGVYYKKDSLNREANDYYNQALHIAKLAKDSVWIGIISGNLADIEWEAGRREKAIELVKKNIEYSMRFNEPLDAMRANLILAEMYCKQKDYNNAAEHVAKGLELMEDKPYFLRFKTDANKILAEISKGKGDSQSELYYLNQYLLFKDSLDENLGYENLQRVSWQWEAEKYQQSIENSELKRKQINQTYFYVITFFALLFVIILLLVNRSKNKIMFKNAELEREQLELSYEKQLVDRELVILNHSLQDFTSTIKQNDLTIQRLRNEVIQNLDHFPDRQEIFNDSLNKMLENHVMTEERWLKFNHIFDRVYPGYLASEKEAYPKLTEYDFRLISLMKLGLNNRSMADLLGISLEGVKKAKQRLKKKMEAD